jgi:hypothetical protein
VGLDYSIGPGLGSLVVWDHRWVIFSVVYLLVRCLMVLAGFGRAGAGDLGFVV